MTWYDFLNPVFGPLLQLGPFWAISILSLVITLVMTVIYKFVTDQKLMKSLKDEQKEYQKEIKSLKDSPKEMMKVQKEMMKKNMEYMKHSLKPTLITMIPILLIFGWMAANLAFEPIYPNETYSITALFDEKANGQVTLIPDNATKVISDPTQTIKEKVIWKLKSSSLGNHVIGVRYNNQTYNKKVLISTDLKTEEEIATFDHSDLKQIKIDYKDLKPLGPNFSIFGWHPGWLGIYIVLSIVLSMILRKLMKVY